MKAAQEVAHHHVVPWLKPEQEGAEREYRRAAMRFVEMGNDFLRKLAGAGIPELARNAARTRSRSRLSCALAVYVHGVYRASATSFSSALARRYATATRRCP